MTQSNEGWRSGTPLSADQFFTQAIGYHQRGQLAEAARGYKDALAVDPRHAGALHFAGVIALQQGRPAEAARLIEQSLARRDDAQAHYHAGLAMAALSRFEEAATHNRRAIALKPGFLDAHTNLGNVLKALGRLDEAAACYRHVIDINPALASAHYNLANVLLDKDETNTAIRAFVSALSADPNYGPAQIGYALALRRQGRPQDALMVVCRALDQNASADAKSLFVECCRSLSHYARVPGLYKHLIAALTEPWTRPRNLAAVAGAVMRTEGAAALVYSRATTDVAHFEPTAAELQMLANDGLLRAVLETALVADTDLERILTAARHELLMMATGGVNDVKEEFLGFACALARQCFTSEYVFDLAEDDAKSSAQLRDRLTDENLSPFAVAVVASYFPLHAIRGSDRLLMNSWPAALDSVLTQQLREPAVERDFRDRIPKLTPIEDDVSLEVQRQYEENPYPRWVKAARIERTVSLDRYLRTLLPLAPLEPANKKACDILIAGCGTGQATLELASLVEDATFLAIDLSRSSLAHAQRKACEAGIETIEYAQADILKLGSLGRAFDFIEVGGVLHHMADPVAAWRELATLLRPGGMMRLSLYSKTATPHVLAARALTAAQGFPATADGIRRARQALRALPDGELAKTITAAPDFYSTSECRDLFFHVQEQRLIIPQLKDAVAQTGMRFLGFCVDLSIAARYRERFPQDTTQTDLDNWHAFENDNAATFIRMYVFVVQRPADHSG